MLRQYVLFLFFIGIRCVSSTGSAVHCEKNTYIDYERLVETDCLIEMCILSENCSQIENFSCPCERDYVVRYNVSTEAEDELDDEEFITHFAVITQTPDDDDEEILIGHYYPCFYDQRDATHVYWSQPDQTKYFISMSLSFFVVFAIILIPLVYLIVIVEFINPDKKKKKNKSSSM